MKAMLYLFLALALAGCHRETLRQQQDRQAFASINAYRMAHNEPPLTWDEYEHPQEKPTP